MKFDIGIFRMAHDMAAHASARQSVIADNIANADTPGYKARDIVSFAETYDSAGMTIRQTRPGHMPPTTIPAVFEIFEDAAFGAESPNGNTVSLEDQMVRAAEAKHQHDLALGIYGKSMDILRAGLGRIR